MEICCVSDLHGYLPDVGAGDLLIICGDLTAADTPEHWGQYFLWQGEQNYKKIIFIAGNHDNRLQQVDMAFYSPNGKVEYLCDSGTEFEGIKIWGSPWTKTFEGINPHCKAFTMDTEEELANKWSLIPHVDILVTHSPSYGVLDEISEGKSVGSETLIKPMIKSGCRLHIFGHIHEAYGKYYNPILGITYVNASHVNRHYKPVNKPIRIEL